MPGDRITLRATFTQDARLYDRARPTYPAALFDAVLGRLRRPPPALRVLEIGCGTGQATLPLAERGCRVLAVDLGADMVGVARENLAGYADVDLLSTFSNHRALPAASREGLFACLRHLLRAEPDQTITKSVAFELSSALVRTQPGGAR